MYIYIFWIQFLFIYINPIVSLFEYCDYNLQLNATQKIYVNSPYYPGRYPSGTSCRYTISAPTGMHLSFRCSIALDKDISSCTSEYFYFNRDGNQDLPGSEFFCGQGNFIRRSFLNTAVISYISSSQNTAGLFSCLIEVRRDDCNCGRINNNFKIAGGVETSINEFPSMAGIIHLDYQRIFCGAVIIHQRYLLSAAHCFLGQETSNLSKMTILVGANDVTKIVGNLITKFYEIENIKIHESFSPQTVQNDIALIRTKRNIIWYDGIGPACLPFKFLTNDLANSKLQVAGWGTKSFGGVQSLKLLKATLDVIPQNTCKSIIQQLGSNQLCTYTPGKDACQFDSGGGLYYNDNNYVYVVGIISFGFTCATNLPSVNTRVSSFLPWIQMNTLNAQFCNK